MKCPAPVEITYKNTFPFYIHFLNSNNVTLNKFIEELKKYGVTTIVRVCEATYDITLVKKEGIQVLGWSFDDGAQMVTETPVAFSKAEMPILLPWKQKLETEPGLNWICTSHQIA
uniref:Uncharacterized protein n=1 Tax=Monodelphis domestica TaxID=13616 RepID=A0A5F8GYM9_MONDO